MKFKIKNFEFEFGDNDKLIVINPVLTIDLQCKNSIFICISWINWHIGVDIHY